MDYAKIILEQEKKKLMRYKTLEVFMKNKTDTDKWVLKQKIKDIDAALKILNKKSK